MHNTALGAVSLALSLNDPSQNPWYINVLLIIVLWFVFKKLRRKKPPKPPQGTERRKPRKPDGRKRRTKTTRYIEPREVSLDTFFRMRQRSMKSYKRMTTRPASTFEGVYILYNRTKHRHYVGQSVDVFNRINQHFRGYGNPDVYHDYKTGDDWTILLVRLDETVLKSLNDLERHMIYDYDAFYNGYNKTRGNR